MNYGMPADFERLKELGISVKGKIVIARYGAGWRGIKPKVAYENGAIGCLIYSLYNVMITIPGTTRADEWIIFGNHHDAWVSGADDPISGASALMETARGLSEMLKSGWRPQRTIKLALWDGEEWGLLAMPQIREGLEEGRFTEAQGGVRTVSSVGQFTGRARPTGH